MKSGKRLHAMKERWVEVAPDADEKQEKQFETWLWGEGIPVGMMGLSEKQEDLRAGNYASPPLGWPASKKENSKIGTTSPEIPYLWHIPAILP